MIEIALYQFGDCVDIDLWSIGVDILFRGSLRDSQGQFRLGDELR